MTDGEFEKIKLLLLQFYSKHPFWRDRNTQYAYKLALKPFRYGDVKESVLAHVRRSAAFPFVAELTAGLEEEMPDDPNVGETDNLHGMSDRERLERLIARLREK